MSGIHPTAVIDHSAQIDAGVSVGPFAVVGPRVRLRRGVTLSAHVVVEGYTTVGAGTSVGVGSVLGSPPQDTAFTDGESWLEIGENTRIREYTTINRGTHARGLTTVGDRCFLMSYVHVAHDCIIESDVTIANSVQIAGHVHVAHHAWLGGLTPIHQFVRIGPYAFVGGGSRVPQDVPPFARAAGNPIKLYGANVVGLERAGFASGDVAAIKRAFRLLFNSDLTTTEAMDRLRVEAADVPAVQEILAFVSASERGVLI